MKSKSLAFAIVSTIAIFGCDQSSPVSDTDVSSREQEKNLKESPPVEELEENRARQAQLLQEKEAEATEAANRERYAKKIADVLSFLNGIDLSFSNKDKDVQGRDIVLKTQTYSDFRYNAAEKALEFLETNTSTGIDSFFAMASVMRWKFFLTTVSPVINTENSKVLELPATVLKIDCDSTYKQISKIGDKRSGFPISDEKLKEFLESGWEDIPVWESEPLPFYVRPELAPRVIAALTDLLELHGVKVSKY